MANLELTEVGRSYRSNLTISEVKESANLITINNSEYNLGLFSILRDLYLIHASHMTAQSTLNNIGIQC